MLFNSIEFLFVFLPVVLVVFWTLPAKFRLEVLIVASFIFYATSGYVPLLFMILGILWIYLTTKMSLSKRTAITIGISFPLATLILFRYLNFIFDNIGLQSTEREHFSFFLDVALPAGISFYSFQMMSYVIDVRRGDYRSMSLRDIAIYISFFPQLIAGPILRPAQIHPQFDAVRKGSAMPDFAVGLRFLTVGLFIKIMFADRLAGMISTLFSPGTETSTIDGAFILLGYSFRIYLDFWAYSIMAIGLGQFFGISIPRNFREPYLSRNPREFWRRWHITLSYWLRDYVYVPLGGNQAYVRNITIVFIACGLWHGAAWNFVVWGAYHAALVIGYHFVAAWWDRIPGTVQVGMNFLLVSLGWPLFFLDLNQYVVFFWGLFSFQLTSSIPTSAWLTLSLAGIWIFLVREDQVLFDLRAPASFPLRGLRMILANPAIQASMVVIAVAFFSWRQTFIYFRF